MEILFTNYDKSKPYKTPERQTKDSVGFDLYSCNTEDILIEPGKVKLVDTNVAMQIPHGFEGQVRSRSGLAIKENIFVLNSPGTLDSDYRGPIGIILANFGNNTYRVKPTSRVAQLVINQITVADLVYANELHKTERNEQGFGSSGV